MVFSTHPGDKRVCTHGRNIDLILAVSGILINLSHFTNVVCSIISVHSSYGSILSRRTQGWHEALVWVQCSQKLNQQRGMKSIDFAG